jgi:hypothetical protein
MQLEAQWVVGFVDGEGCFHVGINVQAEMSAGHQVSAEFTVVQHERDVQILHALKAFFGCGVVRRNHGDRMAYRVRNKEHLLRKILPFFMAHPLKTKKHIDFLKFRDVLLLMESDRHLTHEGVDAIRAIASEMNRGMSR